MTRRPSGKHVAYPFSALALGYNYLWMAVHLSAMTRPLSIICCIVSVSPALVGDAMSEEVGRPGLATRHLHIGAKSEAEACARLILWFGGSKHCCYTLSLMMGWAALEALSTLAKVDGLATPTTPVSMVHARPTVGHLDRAVDQQRGERQVRNRSRSIALWRPIGCQI
jgi:hypothetical protein